MAKKSNEDKILGTMKKRGWTFLTGDVGFLEHGGTFLKEEPVVFRDPEGVERKVFFLIEFATYHEKRNEGRLYIALLAACPELVSSDKMKEVLLSYDYEEETITEEMRLEAVVSYGFNASLFFHDLLFDAEKKEHPPMTSIQGALNELCASAFGVEATRGGGVFERPMNVFHATAWDFMAGLLLPWETKKA